MTETKKETKVLLMPVGRLINENLFEKDAYVSPRGKEGTPQYKVELAFNPADLTGEGTFEDEVLEAVCAEWGDGAEDLLLNGKITWYKDGDKMAAARAEKGKSGDAYKGKCVVRATTIYNKDGQDGPGGIQVFDEACKPIGAANRAGIYPGCFGIAAVTLYCYTDDDGEKCVKFYLSAFQKTGDGEKLISSKDHSTLFKPVSKPSGEADASTGRRRRG